MSNALALNESIFRGRLIKVMQKRTNVPQFSFPRGAMAGGFSRGRGGYRGAGGHAGPMRGAYRGMMPRGSPYGSTGYYRGGRRGGAPGYYAPY